jgi:hypothetical protein
MNPPITLPIPEWQPGFEIPTKHKEAIRQLYKYTKIGLQVLSGIIVLVIGQLVEFCNTIN